MSVPIEKHKEKTKTFGNIEWIILEEKNDKQLLLSKYIIEQLPYHNTYEEITWCNSDIRTYLNNQFMEMFTTLEKDQILLTETINPDNEWHFSTGGENCFDYVFLLSIKEVACLYFGDSSEKLYNKKKTQRYWLERKDPFKHRRIATLINKKNQVWWWWLRSPGRFNVRAAYVHGDGNIGIQGNNVLKGNASDGWCTGGVRPAMWIKTLN